ncbi:MAG: glycosyltransferase family 4 protein [Bacteroidetes bacterium]|nr:glycosyltransferase family 4 protein [Bacteroidota bacterium]
MIHLLIVDAHQFGYHTDTYAYCRWLKDDLDLTVVCWDYGNKRIALDGISVVYVPRSGGPVRRLLRYIRSVIAIGHARNFDVWFIVRFSGCSVLRWFSRRTPKIVDIRTGSVHGSAFRRTWDNRGIRWECSVFRHITVIADAVADVIGLARGRYSVLPLGGEPLEIPPKTFGRIHLLYVGTLNNRHIDRTVEGLGLFLQDSGNAMDISYDIVGGGDHREQERLLDAVRRYSCESLVKYHGMIPNAELRPYLERANAGVAFIPMTPYYDCQPSTKVFEYLLAGMPVLATATRANSETIRSENGILHGDTAEGFRHALHQLSEHRGEFDSRAIKTSSMQHSWQYISRQILYPLITGIVDGDRGTPVDSEGVVDA